MNGKCHYCNSKFPEGYIPKMGEPCPRCMDKCKYCGDIKMSHTGGRGGCIHCSCDRFTTKGKTRDEQMTEYAIRRCEEEERAGTGGHDWYEGQCGRCGKKSADWKTREYKEDL